ncbi:MAG: hypothetical protein M3Y72_09240 [Acidobacteriota bacterium]|nr:hypothetical protein [Acidobacteriota bacterium]
MAVALLQGLAHKSEIDVTIDKWQEMNFGNVIRYSELVEQRLGTCVVTIR